MKKQYIGNIYIITSVQTFEDPSSTDFNGPYVIEEEMYANTHQLKQVWLYSCHRVLNKD